MRKVVYILGANWSGSTMVGSILGSTSQGAPYKIFHVGELHALFKSGRGSKRASRSEFWKDYVGTEPSADLLYRIGEQVGADVIVDSSKLLSWSSRFEEDLASRSVETEYVITFRSFDAIVRSGLKRGKSVEHCLKSLTRYEKYLDRLDGMKPKIVDISSFIRDPDAATARLCRVLDIEYFDGKANYWEFPSDHLYGSSTQRIHYQNPGEASYYTSRGTETDSGDDRLGSLIPANLLEVESRLRQASEAAHE